MNSTHLYSIYYKFCGPSADDVFATEPLDVAVIQSHLSGIELTLARSFPFTGNGVKVEFESQKPDSTSRTVAITSQMSIADLDDALADFLQSVNKKPRVSFFFDRFS